MRAIQEGLARFFGSAECFWLNPQTRYELEVERDRLARELTVLAG